MITDKNNDMTATQLEIKVTTDSDAFLSLRSDWARLLRDAAEDSLFTTHEWLWSAWQWRQLDSELFVLTAWEGAELIGACPLVKSHAVDGPVKVTTLTFLAIPDTQECAVLARKGLESRVIRAFVRHIMSRSDWDRMDLERLRDESTTWKALESGAVSDLARYYPADNGSNPGLVIGEPWEEYYARRSKRLRKGNNHTANKLRRQHDIVEIELQACDTPELKGVDELQETLIDISERSWKGAETSTSLGNDGPRLWLGAILRESIRERWLAVWTLRLDDQLVASEMQLARNGIVYALRADFDSAYRKLSPGTYLNWKILEGLFNGHLGSQREYWMGPGDNPYKSRWRETEVQLKCAVFYNSTLRGRLQWILDIIVRPTAQRVAQFGLKSGD